MDTIGERIYQARKAAGLTQRELGEACSVSAPAVTKWESGESKPSRDSLICIAAATNASLPWLLFGHLPKDEGSHTTMNAGLRESRSVPLLRADELLRHLQNVPDVAAGPRVYVNFPCGERSFAYVLPDDSNAERYPRNTRVVIDPDAKQIPGKMVLAKVGEETPIFGELRMESTPGGRVTIVAPSNPRWPEARSDADELEVVGVMTESSAPAP